MDRRDALKALMALPATTRISVAQLKPDDVIVVESDEHLSQAATDHIYTELQRVWPGRKIVVLTKGITLKVVWGKVD